MHVGRLSRRAFSGALVALALLTTACSGTSSPTAHRQAGPTTTSQPTPSAPPPAPAAQRCYRLGFADAARPTNDATSVPCSTRHTSVTIKVGRLDPTRDGHLLSVDSAAEQAQLARLCRPQLRRWVGGTTQDVELSRLQVVWFAPTVAASDSGADWYRCDLVAVSGERTLAGYTGKLRGVLAGPGGLDSYGLCATGDPSSRGTQHVLCRRRHSWRAVGIVSFRRSVPYQSARGRAIAAGVCKPLGQSASSDPFVYRWSFEWPSRQAWNAGQRYGWCYVPG